MRTNRFCIIFYIAAICIAYVGCKRDPAIVDPLIVSNPGKQKDIVWPSIANSAWPMAHHDPQSTGRSPFVALFDGEPGNSYLGNSSWSSPVIDVDGTVYYEGRDSLGKYVLFARQKNGELKWTRSIDDGSMSAPKNHSSPIISVDGIIYIVSRDHNLYAFTREGVQQWIFKGSISSRGLNIGKDGTLYLVTRDKSLHALNSDGSIKWKLFEDNGFWSGESGPEILFSPDGATIYVGGYSNGLYAVDVSGIVKWKNMQVKNGFSQSRTIDNQGNIYAHLQNDTIVSLFSDGSVRWKNTVIRNSDNYTIDYDGNIYTTGNLSSDSASFRLFCLSYNGILKWSYQIPGYYSGQLICDKNGTVFVVAEPNTILYAVNNDGTIKWIIDQKLNAVFENSPAISNDGSIIFTSYDENAGLFLYH